MSDPRSSGDWKRVRSLVLSESDVCWLCGHPGANSVDHLIPIKDGGHPFDLANLRPAHLRCNQSRGTKPPRPNNPTSRQW